MGTEGSQGMKEKTRNLRSKINQPWEISIIFAALIPLFPEYIAPLLACGSLMAAYYDSGSFQKFKVGILGKIMLVYIAYTAIGLLYTPNFLSTFATLSMWVVMFMVYLALTTVITSNHRFDTALLIISICFGIVGLIGCVQYMLHISLGLKTSLQFWLFIDKSVFEILPIELKPPVQRVSSTFNNSNIFSEAMIMALPIVTYYSFYGNKKKYHLICRFCLMFIAGGIAFSFSRASYLALITIAMVFCLANIKKIVLMLLTLTSGLLLVPEAVMERLFSVSGTDHSISERLRIWVSSTTFIKSNPVFGIGAGISNSWSLLLQKGIDAPHMHNLALQLIIEGGIIALIIFMIAGWKLLHSGFNLLIKNLETRTIGVLILAILFGFVVNSFFDFPLMTPKLVGIFFMVLAISESALSINREQKLIPLQNVLSFQKQIITVSDERVACTNINNTNKL
jgi:O-antigen ligase